MLNRFEVLVTMKITDIVDVNNDEIFTDKEVEKGIIDAIKYGTSDKSTVKIISFGMDVQEVNE